MSEGLKVHKINWKAGWPQNGVKITTTGWLGKIFGYMQDLNMCLISTQREATIELITNTNKEY